MKKLRDITVLMSATSSPTMPGAYRSIKNISERKVRLIGVDMTSDPSAKYLVDSFYQVPPVSDPNYIDIILDICKKENVDIYFPSISVEVSKVAERREEFEKIGVKLSISNLKSVEIANNKYLTYQTLEKAGIPVPRYYRVNSIEDFVKGMEYMGYPSKPVCIKIVNGSGSRGVRIIDANKSRYDIFAKEKPNSFYTSYEDMFSILEKADNLQEMMLVEFMYGPEYTVDLLADKGKVLYIGGRENVQSLMSIAMESVVKKDEAAFKIANDVVKALEMDGNVGFDFMRNENHEPVLMDINPRTTATISLFAAAGLDLRYLRIKQLLGEDLPQCLPIEGTRVRRRYGEIITDQNGIIKTNNTEPQINEKKRILIFAPHPDDEILGCGGTIAKNISQGNSVYICIVTKGQPPLFPNINRNQQNQDDAKRCHSFLGITKTFFLDFPAADLESVKRFDLNKRIMEVVDEVKPHQVYIPHIGDMQKDHQIVVDACMVALRPKYFPQIKKILAYETLSETDWNLPNVTNAFIPNVFVNIDNTLEIKKKALSFFSLQISEYPNARSIEAVEALAKHRGALMHWNAAEAFMLIRELDV